MQSVKKVDSWHCLGENKIKSLKNKILEFKLCIMLII